jgi:hypothetical protein
MIEPCWYELDVPCKNMLHPNWKFPDVEGKEFGVWDYKARDIFNPEWLLDLFNRGITIAEALVFYRAANHNTDNAHLDIHRKHPVRISTYGLNMIIGGQDAHMTWYHTPKINYKPTPGGAGTVYYNWPINTLTEIDRHILKEDRITMVRVGIPHTIIMGNEARWCISARADNTENLYWKQIAQWMRDRSLLIERDTNVSKD